MVLGNAKDVVKPEYPKTEGIEHFITPQKGKALSYVKNSAPFKHDDALVLWPARNKEDLSYLRSRIDDYRSLRRARYALDHLTTLSYDYITVMNIAAYTQTFGKEWFDNLNKYGFFLDTPDELSEALKTLSNSLKVSNAVNPKTIPYVECGGITGYRTLPYPGFDMYKEAEELSTAPPDHGWTASDYMEVINTHMRVESVGGKLNLRDWLWSNAFATSGGSYLAKLHVTYEGVEHTFKANKNSLLDTYTVDELIRLMQAQNRQENKVFPKNELSKVRLALSADDLNYLMQAFVAYKAGDMLHDWADVVSGETGEETLERMTQMWLEIKNKWNMPWDFKAFDHQIETLLIMLIYSVYCDRATEQWPDDPDLPWIISLSMFNFTRSDIILRENTAGAGNRGGIWHQKGKLASGTYFTAIVGSGANKIWKELVTKYISALKAYLKGDDSAYIASEVEKLRQILDNYKAHNIEGGIGKFGILFGANEFLRTWYASERVYGYPGRTIPGLVQRKPWSKEAWSPENTMSNLYDLVVIISRRLEGIYHDGDIWQLWRAVSARWCSLHHIPTVSLGIPRHLGGFGVTPWDGESHITPRISDFPKPKLTVVKTTDYAATRIRDRAAYFGLTLTSSSVEALVNDELVSKVSSDSYSKLRRKLRDLWNDWLKGKSFRIYKKRSPIHVSYPPPITVPVIPFLKEFKSTYGSARHEFNVLQSVTPILRELKIGVKEFIRGNPNHFPKLAAGVNNTRDHIGEQLDWLGGNLTLKTTKLQPLLTNLASNYIAYRVSGFARRRYALKAFSTLGDAMLHPLYLSQWYLSLCRW